MGMPRPMAIKFAAQVLVGAGKMVLKTGRHPGQLKDEVCSPGGITIAGIHAMEAGGVRYVLNLLQKNIICSYSQYTIYKSFIVKYNVCRLDTNNFYLF